MPPDGASVEFEHTSVRSADGVELSAYTAGDPGAPAVVLSNAYLMPVDFMRPLAASLASKYRILTWCTRTPPEGPIELGSTPALGLAAQASDLAAVMDHHAVASAVGVVGWCTGAQVAVRFAAAHPSRVRSLVLLNGAFTLPEPYPRTSYELAQTQMLRQIVRKPYLARAFCKMMRLMRTRSARDGETESELLQRVGTRDQAILEMVVGALSDPGVVYRYALLMDAFYREPDHAFVDDVKLATLVLTTRTDAVAHPERSIEIARRLTAATLHVDDTGDHYLHYTSEPIRRRIAAFLDAHDGVLRP